MKPVLLFLLLKLLSVRALKLTLKQNLNDLQEQLSPEEIGQFLHSINDLPLLAEYIDPSRSRLNFDLYYYYNQYGCADTRTFTWKRVTKILTYGRLSRYDKSILINGDCLTRWPGLGTLSEYDLKHLLRVLPESNPLLDLSLANYTDRLDAIIGKKAHWHAFIGSASFNQDLNFIPAIDLLFKKEFIFFNDFKATNYNLIGPNAVDIAYMNSDSLEETQILSSFIFSMEKRYKGLPAKTLFYWALNIGVSIKYDMRSRVYSFLKRHFDKIIDACPWSDFNVVQFLRSFSCMINEFLGNDSISNESIMSAFRTLITSTDDSVDSSNSIFLAVEFYKWLELSAEYFNVDEDHLADHILPKIIFRSISKTRSGNYSDYFLNFFLAKRQLCSFKYFERFLWNNYDPECPSHELVKVFRHLSWIGGRENGFKMAQSIKKFLSYRFRASYLRRISFDHASSLDLPCSIEIHLEENNFINTLLFSGIYESLMKNVTLVYPLKAEISSSSLLRGLFTKSVNLETILQKFWFLLGSHANGFMSLGDISFDNEDNIIELEYPMEFIPNPWTHPNIMLAAGCVMTLAYLHGIKLTSWRMKKTIFKSVFKIDLSSINTEDSQEEDKQFEDNFLIFYDLNDYLHDIEASDDTKIEEAINEMTKGNESLKKHTKKALKCYQNDLLTKNELGLYSFGTSAGKIWPSKLFRFIEDSTEIPKEMMKSPENLLKGLIPHLSEMNLILDDFNEEDLEAMTNKTTDTNSKERDFARIQIYSLFLGLQPLTRFLKSIEAYEAIFKEDFK